MTFLRRALPLALLAFTFHASCTDDTSDDGSNDSGNDDNMTNPTTSMDGTADSSGADDSSVDLGCAAGAVGETTDGMSDPLMNTWGAPCQTNQDCVELLGDPAAICDFEAVVFELPGGYCTKECTLPDAATMYLADAPDCDPNGGVTCQGVAGQFSRCAIECTDDMQCNRDGYICRNLPLIGQTGDPKFCLMPDCCMDTCAE